MRKDAAIGDNLQLLKNLEGCNVVRLWLATINLFEVVINLLNVNIVLIVD